MDKISVVMTTYNGERFLVEQLVSLLAQTRVPDEVIICDDCSTDGTVAILRSFIANNGLTNWYVFENPDNFGYIKNFREAMRRSSGDIVFLCDQDDIWEPEKIEQMATAMDADPAIRAVACNYRLIDAEGAPLISNAKKYYKPSKRKTADNVSRVKSGKTLYYNIAQGCAYAYRRNLVEMYCGVKDCWDLPHDWALNLLAYQEQGLYYLDRELLLYRIHGNNQMGVTNSHQKIYNRIPILLKYSQMIGDAVNLPISDDVKNEIRTLVEFTRIRVQWLRERRLSVWIGGFFRYFTIVRECFFLQYIKDLALVISNKDTQRI